MTVSTSVFSGEVCRSLQKVWKAFLAVYAALLPWVVSVAGLYIAWVPQMMRRAPALLANLRMCLEAAAVLGARPTQQLIALLVWRRLLQEIQVAAWMCHMVVIGMRGYVVYYRPPQPAQPRPVFRPPPIRGTNVRKMVELWEARIRDEGGE